MVGYDRPSVTSWQEPYDGQILWRRGSERERFWQLLIRNQKTSGQSIAAFCRERRVSQASLYSWRKKLTASKRQAKASFLPVRVGKVLTSAGPHVRRRLCWESCFVSNSMTNGARSNGV